MKRNQILSTIRQLACSQGFYSRLYSFLVDAKENNYGEYDGFLTMLEEQSFTDAVDLVIFLES